MNYIVPKECLAGDETSNAAADRNERETYTQKPHFRGTATRRISQVFRVVESRAMFFVCPEAHKCESDSKS